MNWTPSSFGTYTVYAIAYDNDGNTSTTVSSVVSFGPVSASACGTIASGSDDAEENLTTGAVNLTSSDLELTTDAADQIVGIRYSNMTIPQGATITSAYIQFVCDEVNSTAISLRIQGHNVDNSPAITAGAYNLSSRVKTTASVTWNPTGWELIGESVDQQETTDLSTIVQEIVDRPGWSSGNAMTLFIDRLSVGGKRIAQSFENEGAPSFCVQYTIDGVNGQSQVTLSSDDAEQNLATGAVNLTSTDLELVTDGAIQQQVGIRFTNISIPPGAYVTNAFIQYTTDDNGPFAAATSLSIYGNDVANAATFTATANNISSRTKTSTNVSWTPLSWTTTDLAVQDQRTPDISSIINEVISNSGWASGNSIAFLTEGSGNRGAWSWDGSASKAPILVFTYVIIAPLPLNLLSFTGNVSKEGNTVLWSTIDEKEVDYFVLQSSDNGYDFTDITKIKAKNKLGLNKYEYLDPISESMYYRIKSVFNDDQIEYSSILYLFGNRFTISLDKTKSFKFYPNPLDHASASILTIVIDKKDFDKTIYIRSMATGGLVLERKIPAGINSIEISVSELSSGTYLISDEKGFTDKMIVL